MIQQSLNFCLKYKFYYVPLQPSFVTRGLKVRLKLEVMKTLVSEKEGEDTLVSALARLHLPDTDAMEWKNKQHSHKYNEVIPG